MWKGLAAKPQWRCLIPVTHFAEAEGPKGAMTRTWVNIKDHPFIAWGGLWRDSAEWGPVYSGAMTDANDGDGAAARPHAGVPVRERMGHLAERDRSTICWPSRRASSPTS